MRDLRVEQFSGITVTWEGDSVRLQFPSPADAQRAAFLLKNALELKLPIQFRVQPES